MASASSGALRSRAARARSMRAAARSGFAVVVSSAVSGERAVEAGEVGTSGAEGGGSQAVIRAQHATAMARGRRSRERGPTGK